MKTQKQSIVGHPRGEQPTVEVRSAIADTFAGRIHVEWDAMAPITPFGQLPFFIDYLKQAALSQLIFSLFVTVDMHAGSIRRSANFRLRGRNIDLMTSSSFPSRIDVESRT
jgi:hypothetical protein